MPQGTVEFLAKRGAEVVTSGRNIQREKEIFPPYHPRLGRESRF